MIMPWAMWWCTQMRSPRPGLKPVSSGRGCLRLGVVWPCRMLTLETPVDSRSSMPTTDAGEDFMATGCVEVAGPRSQVCRPLAVNALSRISRSSCPLAKQVVQGLTGLIAYRVLLGVLGSKFDLVGGLGHGRGGLLPCWAVPGLPRIPGRWRYLAGGAGPWLPVASRCFQMLPGAACQ